MDFAYRSTIKSLGKAWDAFEGLRWLLFHSAPNARAAAWLGLLMALVIGFAVGLLGLYLGVGLHLAFMD